MIKPDAELEGVGKSPRNPVNPTHCETQARVNEARSILAEGTRDGNVRCHFRKADADRVYNGSDEGVCDERASGTSLRNGFAATDEETRSNGTTCIALGLDMAGRLCVPGSRTYCDHLKVAALEIPLELLCPIGALLFEISGRGTIAAWKLLSSIGGARLGVWCGIGDGVDALLIVRCHAGG